MAGLEHRRYGLNVTIWIARVVKFFVGLFLCSVGIWVSLRVNLGLGPWDVLHAGISDHTGLSFGRVAIIVGVIVALASALMRVRLGLGTILNAVVIGLGLDVLIGTPWLEDLSGESLILRLFSLLCAIVLLSTGIALYVGAGFGSGPRDSLMVGFQQRGLPLGWSRLLIEVTVLGVGWLLGGPVGVGTLVLALGIGPAVQVAFTVLRQDANHRQPKTDRAARRVIMAW